MRIVRKLIGVVALLATASLGAEIAGTYVLSFGEYSVNKESATASKRAPLVAEWRESTSNEEVTLRIRTTDVANVYQATWKDSDTEDVDDDALKIYRRDKGFSFLFPRKFDGVSYIFHWEGDIGEGELQGTLDTVWGKLPMTGKLTIPDIAGTYALSFGELSPPHTLSLTEGKQLLDEWLNSDGDDVTLEVRATDVENQFDAIWSDSTTKVVRTKDRKPPRIYIRPYEVSLLFSRRIGDVPYIFLYLCEIENGELHGTLDTPWGKLPMSAKLIAAGKSEPSQQLVSPEEIDG